MAKIVKCRHCGEKEAKFAVHTTDGIDQAPAGCLRCACLEFLVKRELELNFSDSSYCDMIAREGCEGYNNQETFALIEMVYDAGCEIRLIEVCSHGYSLESRFGEAMCESCAGC